MNTYNHSSASTTYLSSSSSCSRMDQERSSSPCPVVKKSDHDDVPSTVQKLLLSTKRLQEVLHLWSVKQATEGDVSDLYVKIGNELNLTISAFAQHQIDLSDIHSIPGALRGVLERCLSEDPSPEVLQAFMPEVRHVLFRLLKGLQSRQESWQLATEQGRHHLHPSVLTAGHGSSSGLQQVIA